jgi:uncharacterized protein (TIGR02594 family)
MAKTPPRKPAVPMAPAYMKTDSIQVDTSKAPWMTFALSELKKKVKEHEDYDSFAKLIYLSAVQQHSSARLLGGELSGSAFQHTTQRRSYLLEGVAQSQMGEPLKRQNPEIVKYFDGVKTDPTRDPKSKGRSWDIAPVNQDGTGNWQVTAWCAAFVNWCLKQAGSPHLGYATAEAWLRFGTPLPTPTYGCVTIIPPSKSTGSTTGHVAFYTGVKGDNIQLVGGNQGDKVSEMEAQADRVLGYRWPTAFNYFLLDRGSALA